MPRAQIFQAFDALKGYRELLKEKERVIVEKRILSEDDLEQLDQKVHQIQNGMMISIIYFDQGNYIKLKGRVAKINLETKIIQIVKTKIELRSIVEIEIL